MVLIDINVQQHRCLKQWYLEGGVKVHQFEVFPTRFFYGGEAKLELLFHFYFYCLVF